MKVQGENIGRIRERPSETYCIRRGRNREQVGWLTLRMARAFILHTEEMFGRSSHVKIGVNL